MRLLQVIDLLPTSRGSCQGGQLGCSQRIAVMLPVTDQKEMEVSPTGASTEQEEEKGTAPPGDSSQHQEREVPAPSEGPGRLGQAFLHFLHFQEPGSREAVSVGSWRERRHFLVAQVH